MEAAQYLSTLLTNLHQNFTKWAHFTYTLQVSLFAVDWSAPKLHQMSTFYIYFTGFQWLNHLGLNGGQIWKCAIMEAAQYLRPLLTNPDWNFAKWALFGHTLQDSDDGGCLTSMEANTQNEHFWQKWHQILVDLWKSTLLVKKWDIERPPFCNVMSISKRPNHFWRLFLH